MANATSRLTIAIDAKNNASSALKTVKGDLQGLDSAASSVAGGLSGLAKGAGIAGIVALGSAAVSAAFDMSRLAATAADIETSFNSMASLAGAASDEMFAGLKEASRGAISDTDLMLAANRAMLLGVADSTQEMVALMDVARARSQAMGITTTQAFQDIVNGIGRESTMILDNLGIKLKAEQVNQAYADSIGKSVSELTDEERKLALVNAVLKESTDIVKANAEAGDDAASHFERMDASIQNAKEALGQLFSPAIVAVADLMAQAAGAAAEAMTDFAEGPPQLQTLTMQMQGINNMLAIHRQALADAEQGSEEYNIALNRVKEAEALLLPLQAAVNAELERNLDASTSAEAATNALSGAMGAVSSSAASVAANLAVTNRALGESTLAANLAQEAFNNLRAASMGISSQIEQAATQMGVLIAGKIGGDAGLAKQQAVTEELTAQRRLWREMGYEETEINTILLPGMIAQMNEAERAVFKTATGTAKISDAVKEADQAFSELEGRVAGVLSGALDVGVGVDPDKLLEAMGFPREDTINENARRLADIAVKGLAGQEWLSEFQREVPDIWNMIRTAQDPKAEAAMLLKDFQDGLLTSPIDKAKAKEIVRRQIMGDQNMAALATEIANELAAEMGIPLQQALAATKGTLGGGGGEEAAATFSEAAASGLASAGGGVQFVDTFVEQMKSRYSLLATAGRDAGSQWGTAFLEVVGDHVPSGLISLLTELVTPGVMAKFAQQGSLTGSTP